MKSRTVKLGHKGWQFDACVVFFIPSCVSDRATCFIAISIGLEPPETISVLLLQSFNNHGDALTTTNAGRCDAVTSILFMERA